MIINKFSLGLADQAHLKYSGIRYDSLFPDGLHASVHALLLDSLASLEAFDEVDKVLGRAAAVLLDLLQGGLEQAVGHLIPREEMKPQA